MRRSKAFRRMFSRVIELDAEAGDTVPWCEQTVLRPGSKIFGHLARDSRTAPYHPSVADRIVTKSELLRLLACAIRISVSARAKAAARTNPRAINTFATWPASP